MLAFVRSSVAHDVAGLHPTLWSIVREIADWMWAEYTHQENVYVTGLWRSHAETVRIYREAGLPSPASSVHETTRVLGDPWSGCRGADLSVRMHRAGQPYETWPTLPPSVVRDLVAAVNQKWRYQPSGEHQVALFHHVSGPHIHLQCRPGQETVERATVT